MVVRIERISINFENINLHKIKFKPLTVVRGFSILSIEQQTRGNNYDESSSKAPYRKVPT